MKIKTSVYTGIAIILTVLTACGLSQSELAVKKIKVSEELLTKGDTLNSLIHLDSIARLYPEAVTELHKAIEISNRIYGAQLAKQRENLATANTLISNLVNEFKPEKGEFEKGENSKKGRNTITLIEHAREGRPSPKSDN